MSSDDERTEAMKKVLTAVEGLSLYEGIGVLSCAEKILFLRNEKRIKKFWIKNFNKIKI